MTKELIEGQVPDTPAVEDPPAGTPEAPMFSQADVDRKVQEGVATNARKLQEQIDEGKAKREREKLEADGKYEELYKQTSGDIEGLRQDVAKRELNAQTREALDAAGLSQYAPIFVADLGTLEGRQALIGNLASMTDGAVATGVAAKLQTPAPPASPGTPKPLDLNAQIAVADAEAVKTGDWAESTRLKNQKLDR